MTLRDDVHITDLHGPVYQEFESIKNEKIKIIEEIIEKDILIDDKIVQKSVEKIWTKETGKIEIPLNIENTEIIVEKIEKEVVEEVVEEIKFLFPEIAFRKEKKIQFSSKYDVVDSSHFLYSGECSGAEEILGGLSSSFQTPLNLLRRQYHKIDRKIND